MAWQNLPYIVILSVASAFALVLAAYAWRRRSVAGGKYFTAMLVVLACWAFTNAGEMAALTLAQKILWSKISYLAIICSSPLWLLFAVQYSRHEEWITRRRIVALWVFPITYLILVWTNEAHGLIWPSITPTSDRPGDLLVYGHGIGVVFNLIFTYTILLGSAVLLIQTTLQRPPLYRRQIWTLLIGLAIPWLGNLLYLLGIGPLPGLDYTPIAFIITGLAVVWSIFRFHMLDVVPIAHNAIMESMSDGMIVLDRQNRVVDINPAACKLIGSALNTAVGTAASVVLKDWPELAILCDEALELQTETLLHDGRWIDLRLTPLLDHRSQISGQIMVLRDITAQKQAAAKLQEYTRELETRNAELDSFAHTVAHDLKNPLGAMVGYSEMILEYFDQMERAEMQSSLKMVSQTGMKMANIIDELMLLSSLRKAQQVKIGPFDMEQVVYESRRRMDDVLNEAQAEVILPDSWPLAIGYGAWVEEVWVNYLSNAVKYGGKPPRIELGWQADQPANGREYLRFWVRDNGLGLSPVQQKQLFVEFARLEQTRAGGHGLGLSIVRRVVDKLAGQVGVESEVGVGSTFYFTLPAAED
jgi:PAS domain S-box-containing protein